MRALLIKDGKTNLEDVSLRNRTDISKILGDKVSSRHIVQLGKKLVTLYYNESQYDREPTIAFTNDNQLYGQLGGDILLVAIHARKEIPVDLDYEETNLIKNAIPVKNVVIRGEQYKLRAFEDKNLTLIATKHEVVS